MSDAPAAIRPRSENVTRVSGRPTMRLKKSSTQAEPANQGQRALPGVGERFSGKTVEKGSPKQAAPLVDGLKQNFQAPVILRSGVSELSSTSTSLRSSEERVTDLGNQIDV